MPYSKPSFDRQQGRVVAQNDSLATQSSVGNDGDFVVMTVDTGYQGRSAAKLVGPKTNGAWPTNGQIDSNGNQIFLPIRSKTMLSSELISGWSVNYSSLTPNSAPTDFTSSNNWGGQWYSSAGGTVCYFGRTQYGGSGAPLAFFSAQFQITTLPESGRFFYVGQIGWSSGNYGYCARIDSSGNVTIRLEDQFSGSVTLDSGMTCSVNDYILVERFGHRMSVYKTAGTARELLDADAASTSRPLNARLPVTPGADGYGGLLSVQSFGISTDSASVRIGNIVFLG